MIRFLLCLAALAGAALSVEAQILGARAAKERAPIRAVAAPPAPPTSLPLAVSHRTVLWDGMEVRKQVMTFAPGIVLEMNWDLMEQWRRVEAPGASGTWMMSGARLRLAVLPATPPAGQLSQERWSTLVTSYLARGAENIRVLCDDDTQANPQMLRPLGWRTRVFECAYEMGTQQKESHALVLAACSDGGTTFMFALDGPAASVRRTQPDFQRFLTSVQPVQK